MEELKNIYNEINKRLDLIDFSNLWDNFKKYDFAVYDSEKICYNNEIYPIDERFLGNTAIEYNGKNIAIWKIEEEVKDFDILAYCLVHEMFHAFQKENNEVKYPDDLVMLDYLNIQDNYDYKYEENKILVSAYKNSSLNMLGKFKHIRRLRKAMIGSYIKQEFYSENIEGSAEYVGLLALKKLSFIKYEKKINDYLDILENDKRMLFNIRRVSYFVGAIYLSALKKASVSIKYDFNSEATVYEATSELYTEVESNKSEIQKLDKEFEDIMNERKSKVEEFIKNSKREVELQGAICGYDPMNMIKYESFVYCKNFLFIKSGMNVEKIDGPLVVMLKKNTLNFITKYYL